MKKSERSAGRVVHSDRSRPVIHTKRYALDLEGDDDEEGDTITADVATRRVRQNLCGYIDIEIDKYILTRANEPGGPYALTIEQQCRCLAHVTNEVHRRKEMVENSPIMRFLELVQGYMVRSAALWNHNTDKNDAEAQRTVHNYIKSMAERDNPNVDAVVADALKAQEYFTNDYLTSGCIVIAPLARAAISATTTELRNKRGCRGIFDFDALIAHERLREQLAHLVALHIAKHQQLNPRRDYKVADYARIKGEQAEVWLTLWHEVRRLGGSVGYREVRGRSGLTWRQRF